jgi:polysaccharide pyruvyl transferase WcaK-like protein
MNIKVLGWYNHGNVGDEAYKLAFPLLFKGHNVECVEVIDPEDKPDLVILGGGDVVYPSFTKYIRDRTDLRRCMASVSLTDNSDVNNLGIFERRFVRDYRSNLIADRAGHPATYLPDFTFALKPDRAAGRAWLEKAFGDESNHELYEKVVVVVASNYLTHGKLELLARDFTTFQYMSQQVADVADNTNASFVFLPFGTTDPWDDRVANAWVCNRCKYWRKNLMIWERLDVQTTLNIIAASDAVVSSRLHSTIFSTLAGVPFIDFTHHTKNLGFIEVVEKTQWSLPFWEFSVTDYRNMLHSHLDADFPDDSLRKFTMLAKEKLKNVPAVIV